MGSIPHIYRRAAFPPVRLPLTRGVIYTTFPRGGVASTSSTRRVLAGKIRFHPHISSRRHIVSRFRISALYSHPAMTKVKAPIPPVGLDLQGETQRRGEPRSPAGKCRIIGFLCYFGVPLEVSFSCTSCLQVFPCRVDNRRSRRTTT